jgi:quinol monooxygenase YgiN
MRSVQRIILSVVLIAAFAGRAQGENAAPAADHLFVVTYIDVTLAGAPHAIGMLQHYRDVLADMGNAGTGLYEQLGQPGHFAILEEWPNRAAYDAPARQAAAAALQNDLREIEAGPPDSNVFRSYATGLVKPPAGGRARVWTVSHFEIQAARLADFVALANPFAQSSRSGPGFIRFDILREAPPRQNQFTIIEGWSSPQASEAHRAAAAARDFRAALAPMLTGPFDDRVYGKFN